MTDLFEVQRLDVECNRLQHQRENLPQIAELAAAQAEHARHQDGIDVVNAARIEVAVRQKRAEDEAQILAAKVTADEERLYSGEVKGIKDLEALQHEIAGLQQRQAGFEDNALIAMEEAESLTQQIDALEAERSGVDGRIAALEGEISSEQASIDQQLADAQAARVGAAEQVDAALLAEYERLRPAFGSATAVRFDGSNCVGCPSAMPAMEVDRIKHSEDSVLSCDECGRIVLR